jgi:hypothetical protein
MLGAATASGQTVIVTNLEPGSYHLEVAPDGTVTITKATKVAVNPRPPAPDLTARGEAIRAAAAQAADPKRAESTANLIAGMEQLSAWVQDETLSDYYQITESLKFVFPRAASHESWQPVRKLLFDELAKIAQDGGDDSAYATYFAEAIQGLKATLPEGELQADGQFLKWLLEFFIKYILPMILKEEEAMLAAQAAGVAP